MLSNEPKSSPNYRSYAVKPSRTLINRKRKLLAIARAERRLQNRLADIDWEDTVLRDAVEALELAVASGHDPQFTLPQGSITDFVKQLTDGTSDS